MSKTTILYKDVATGAAEDAEVSASSALPAANPRLLPEGAAPGRLLTLEPNRWLLDGTFRAVSNQQIAFWSSGLSGADGSFETPPQITILFDKQYTSVGLYLVFDTDTREYCSEVSVAWYQGGSKKQEAIFHPDGPAYFCSKTVESYDKIVLTLNATNIPRRRARLNQIVFGVYRTFDMTEIRSASIVNESSLSALELPISTMRWVLDSREPVEFLFQLKQPVEVWNNNALIGVYYIDGSKRTSGSIYSIECYDAFGVLDETPFPGGVYNGVSAQSLFTEVVGSDFEVVFDGVSDTQLTGAILPGQRRDALRQILFRWGVLASTDGGGVIRVFPLPSFSKAVDSDHTFTGVSVETASVVTEVRVTAHAYTEAPDGTVEIGGKKYQDTTTVYTVKNPNITSTDKQNIKEVSDGTLVSPDVGQKVAQRMYDYYSRRDTQRGRIVWSGERLGDKLTIPTPWDTEQTGHVQRMEIKLSNTVVASVESLGV